MDKELFDEPTQQSGYRSVCRIGANPLLEVLLAIRVSEGDNELVVMKRVRSAHREDYAFIKRLLGAARLALPLAHPNVVGLREVMPDSMSIVSEYLPADSLQAMQAMQRRELPVAMACSIATSVAAALVHAHSSASRPEIAHQALSPLSILVSDSGDVKLDDFGAMRVLATHAGGGDLAQQVMRYAAPEAGSGNRRAISASADLYSLGAVLHEALTGMPFSRQALPRPSIKNAQVPPRLDLLVAQLLSAQAERRPSAAEAYEQLLALPQASRQELAQWAASFSASRAQRRAVEQRAFELASARGLTPPSMESAAMIASGEISTSAAVPSSPDAASAIPIEVVDAASLGGDPFDALVASSQQLIDERAPYSSVFPLAKRRSHADTGMPSSHSLSPPDIVPHKRRWLPAAVATATLAMLGSAAVWVLAEEAAERAGAHEGSAEILVPDDKDSGSGDGAAASNPELAHRAAPIVAAPSPPAATAAVTQQQHQQMSGDGDAPPVKASTPRGRRSARQKAEVSRGDSTDVRVEPPHPELEATLAPPPERREPAPKAAPKRVMETLVAAPAAPTAAPKLKPRAVEASSMKRLSGETPTLRISGLDSPAAPSSTRSIRVQICASAEGKVTSVTAKVPPEVLASLRSSIARWTYAPYLDKSERGAAVPVCFVDSIKMQLEH